MRGRRVGRELRGAPLRHPLGDVAARGVPPLPGRGLPAGRRAPLPAGQPRRHGDPAALHAAGRADLDRRGVPRRDRLGGAVRRRADDRPPDQGRGPRRGRPDRVGRRRDARSSWPRSRRTCASPTGSWSCRRARRRRSSRRCRSGGCGASARRPRWPWPSTGSARSATSRRCRRTSSSAASASTARRWSIARARDRRRPGPRRRPGEVGRARAHVRRRHERPRGHRADAPGDGRRASPAGCARPASGPGTVAVKIRDSGFRTITRQRTLAEPTDLTEPIYATALELARPEVARDEGPAARGHGLEPRRARAAVAVRHDRAAAPAGGRGGRRAPPPLRRADA